MAAQPGFLQYFTAAFNARPFGMVVAPNWVGLAAFSLLGLANPGFWVLGAGLELGYLLMLSTNERFQRTVAAKEMPVAAADDWTARIGKALLALSDRERRRYQAIAERCRSVLDIQTRQSATDLVGLEPQSDGLARLTWMYLRLLLARQAIERVQGEASTQDLPAALKRLELQLAGAQQSPDLRRSLEGQIEIVRQRIAHRAEAERQMAYIDAELARIEQQVELIREQAALSTDPEILSRRIDEIAATLSGTSQWIRDQQQILGAMDDLLIDSPPPTIGRAKELQ
jgi:hypothetical protein